MKAILEPIFVPTSDRSNIRLNTVNSELFYGENIWHQDNNDMFLCFREEMPLFEGAVVLIKDLELISAHRPPQLAFIVENFVGDIVFFADAVYPASSLSFVLATSNEELAQHSSLIPEKFIKDFVQNQDKEKMIWMDFQEGCISLMVHK